MEPDQWKQKYYNQLDELEKKEQDWETLENTLKRAIGRLSLAAEGQHTSLDRHIGNLRNAIKNKINRLQLESIIDDISKILSKIEDKESGPSRDAILALESLISKLSLPEQAESARKKLLKKLNKSDDEKRDTLIKDSLSLLSSVIEIDMSKSPGLLDRLFSKTQAPSNDEKNSTSTSAEQQLKIYKDCFLTILNNLDNPDSPQGSISALKLNTTNATQKEELDKLTVRLSSILSTQLKQSSEPNQTQIFTGDKNLSQPSIQELLIRLIEQLIVPADLEKDANEMKHRLEQETNPDNWKALLKDVASLINSIRSRMQKEKHEFESFLQQVTDRLKVMDNFLHDEIASLDTAKLQGKEFDDRVNLNVSEMRLDINQATDLSNLKDNVNLKLDTISDYIQLYRDSENERMENSQHEIQSMQEKMKSLETQTLQLKKLVIEKNKLAMFDALTGIPNRLSYEKKSAEEIARWKRFSTPLSLAIWDIDLFKQVNDTYGHKAGDKVLKTVAQLLAKHIRTTDFFARYGGEEFVMLLPGTKEEETLRLVNKLREKVEACGFHYHGSSVKITISCGVSCFKDGDQLSQVFDRADAALYKAKENGRNQCVISSCLSD